MAQVCSCSSLRRIHFRGHRSRAGCLSASQAMPVQVRLSAPFSFHQRGGRQQRSRASKTLRDRGSTGTPCHFQIINCGVAKWEGTGFISRQRVGSIPASATNFIHGLLDHSGGHPPRKRESAVQSRGGPPISFNRGKVENQGSLISSLIVVQLHVPQPFLTRR